MKKYICAIGLLFSLSAGVFATEYSDMDLEIYPKAKQGMKKIVYLFEKKEKEEDYKLEIKFGKDLVVDDNFHHFLGGKLEEKDVEGWGYPYYIFSGDSRMVQTLMAFPLGSEREKRVYYPAATKILPYHSKLPLVLYVPEDVKVEVSLWNRMQEIKEVSR
ncbi:ecotin [Fusobacterium necrophorum]|uniref:Ecotin n=1 Tax=Fusobacterium necrophorum TaxID=859 RepID=A0A4Q2L1T7_9FUSO|nr:ecotin family protein [Fusobacterium necrophorum]RXZ70343.1 ecotin [Fusobacterium necrophorum]